jgi:aminoglycoside phosphotransferase (APT) family kinase protein
MHSPAPPGASPIDDALLQAASEFFPDLTAVDAVAGHPDITKVTTPAGLRRLRRWPPTATLAEIGFSREVMATARAAGLTLVPELVAAPGDATESALRLGTRLYTAQEWLPGTPPARAQVAWPEPEDRIDVPVALTPGQFSQIITAVAQIHTATSSLTGNQDVPTAPLSMLPGAVHQAHDQHLRVLRGRARREPAIQRWLATGERLLASAEPIVAQAAPDQQLPSSVIHLGLWPTHVLIAGEPVVGLLGWETVSAGSPLLDLAQAIVRLQGWSDEAVEAAVGAYGTVRPPTPDERRLLPAVAALDAVATTGRLLEQTYAVAETARPPTALRAGIDTMLRSMSALERSLNAQAAVGKSKRTPWRRGPHAIPGRQGGTPRERRR